MATPRVFSKKKTAQEQYVESLDPLLKRNKGGFTTPGYDVSSNRAYILPDGRAVEQPQGLEGGIMLPSYYDSPYTMQQFGVLGARDDYLENYRTDPKSYRTDAVSFLRKFYPQEAKPLGTLSDGGVYYSNGTIKYSDGTERRGDPNAYGVASMADGSIRYSDGSVRVVTPRVIYSLGNGRAVYSDGTIRYTAPAQEQGGVNTLQSAIFGGQNFPITQAYGNYNPTLEPNPQGINYGLDIGANNQLITAPFRGRVVKRLYDDGTRFGSRSKHMGYGNSVLIQLETGEMLRFSHLSGTDLQEGDIIEPGMVIGTTGATGNVTGPHLDLEYYDANGRISNPENLSILRNGGLIEGQILNPNELSDQERQLTQRLLEDYKNPPKSENKPYSELIQSRVLGPKTNLRQEVPQPTQPQGIQLKVGGDLSDTVANIGKAANLPEYGVSEAINSAGKVASQAVYDTTQKAEDIGRRMGLPETLVGDIGRGDYSFTSPGQYAKDVLKANNAPELGVSEAYDQISQGVKGVHNLTANALQNAGNLVKQANPFNPSIVMASGEFNQNQPIGDKVNRNLIESNILMALDDIKSTFNINPQKAIDTVGRGVSAVASDAEKGASAIQSGVGNISESVGSYLNRAKGAISDTFDRESDDNGGDNPIEKAVNSASSVFKKSSGSSSSKSSSKSSSSKSPSKSSSKSSNSSGAVKTNSNTIVNTNTGKAYQVPKTSKPMSPVPVASKNINYSPVPKSNSSKPSSKSSNSSVFKKVTSIIKSLFGR